MNITQMRHRLGMVIPTWFPDTLPPERMQAVLASCLVDAAHFAEPSNVVVVIDGSELSHHAAQRVRDGLRAAGQADFRILFQTHNTGKGGAVVAGAEELLTRPSVEFIAVRDHDNDHLANEAVNLCRHAAQMACQAGSDLVAVIGRRHSVHRHLGFVRGEYEWMLNEVIFEAVKFALAREGRAVGTHYFAAYEPVPDMQSGFKVYTRSAAELLVNTLRQAQREMPDLDMMRHGAEVPALVEVWLRGGAVGEVTRLAWENQPMSTYNLAGRVPVKGSVLAWALRRTGVPPSVARQLLTNAIARRLMAKEEQGLADLLSLANWTLERLGGDTGERAEPLTGLPLPEYF